MSLTFRRTAGGLLPPVMVLVATVAASGQSAEPPSPAAQKLKELRSGLDRDFIAGPSISDPLNCRSIWQTRLPVTAEAPLKDMNVGLDQIFAWDSVGVITRIKASNGDQLWQAATSSKVDRVLSVNIVPTPAGDRAAVVTDTQLFLFDAGNGFFASRQGFTRIANSPAIPVPPYLVYGTRAGQVVWHQYLVAHDSLANQLDGLINTAPRLVNNEIVSTSTGGTVAVFDSHTARLIWERTMTAAIAARPTADGRAVWIPCKDQYLWCLSMRDGHTLWKYFTQSPLDSDPSLLGDSLYMYMPDEGLVCFDPVPREKIEGVVRWRAPDVKGQAIGLNHDGVMVWEKETRTMRILEEKTGAVIKTVKIPGAMQLLLTAPIDGDLVIACEDGRVQRLTPVSKRPAPPTGPATPATPATASKTKSRPDGSASP